MIIRKAKNPRGWTSVPNAMLEDGELSFKARGLLGYLVSRPDDWSTDSVRLARSLHARKDGRDGIRTGLAELEAARYLVRTRLQNDAGHWSTITEVYDERQPLPVAPLLPDFDDEAENPTQEWHVDNPVDNLGINHEPTTGFPASVNPALLTTLNNHRNSSAEITTDAPVENSGEKSVGSASLKTDAAGGGAVLAGSPSGLPGSGSALTEKASLALDASSLAAIQKAQGVAPHLAVFALRAHLVGALRRPVDFAEALGWLELATLEAGGRHQRVTIADVVLLATSTIVASTALVGSASQEVPASGGASLVGSADSVGSADG